MILLQLLPLYAITFIANLQPSNRVWHWIATATLFLGNLLVALLGLGMLLAGPEMLQMTQPNVPAEVLSKVGTTIPGMLLILTGIFGMLLLLPQVRGHVIRALRLKMEAKSSVHMVAMLFALWLVGQTMATVFTLADLPAEMVAEGIQISVAQLWEMGIAFVLFAVLGVGLGLRRSTGETLRRLGLTGIDRRQLLIILAAIIALNIWDSLVSLFWYTLAPESFERTSIISESIFGDLMNPLGAVTIGLAAGIGEEILFRGALQPRFGLFLANILFVVGHTQYELSPALFSVFVIGLVLGYIRQRENTTSTIVIHAGYNIMNVILTTLLS